MKKTTAKLMAGDHIRSECSLCALKVKCQNEAKRGKIEGNGRKERGTDGHNFFASSHEGATLAIVSYVTR